MKHIISIFLTLSLFFTACSKSQQTINTAEILTVPHITITEPSVTEIFEFQSTVCECEVCERKSMNDNGVSITYFGHDIFLAFGFWNVECIAENEKFILAKRAIALLVDLDSDYENTIEQIRFEPTKFRDEWVNGVGFVEKMFKEGSNIESIFVAHPRYDTPRFHVRVGIDFYNEDTTTYICVVFAEEDDEWVIYNVYDSSMGH